MDDASKIIPLISSPMSLFALIILVCNVIFAICATVLKDKELFKYCIHMFLAVVFFFGTIVLWSPACLYHPSEVEKFKIEQNSWIPTLANIICVMIYMGYQVFMANQSKK